MSYQTSMYQKTMYPSFSPLALYMPGGNRKNPESSNNLKPRFEFKGKIYYIYDSKGKKIIYDRKNLNP